jgi:hypothetical protein
LTNGDGWQAVDATPQEQSDLGKNKYECGPASVNQIKINHKQRGIPYDTDFVLGEVAAISKTWVPTSWIRSCTTKLPEDNNYCLYEEKSNVVGTKVLTKALGSWAAEDVVTAYKNPNQPFQDLEQETAAVTFTVSDCAAHASVGSDFHCSLIAQNTGDDAVTVSGMFEISIVPYSHDLAHSIKSHPLDAVEIAPSKSHTFTVRLTESDYISALEQGFDMDVSITAKAEDSSKVLVDSFMTLRRVRLVSPEVSVAVNKAGKQATVTVTFTNPLSVALHHALFKVDSIDGKLCEGSRCNTIGTGLDISVGSINSKAVATKTFTIAHENEKDVDNNLVVTLVSSHLISKKSASWA